MSLKERCKSETALDRSIAGKSHLRGQSSCPLASKTQRSGTGAPLPLPAPESSPCCLSDSVCQPDGGTREKNDRLNLSAAFACAAASRTTLASSILFAAMVILPLSLWQFGMRRSRRRRPAAPGRMLTHSSKNFQVSAPSNLRTRTEAISFGSKLPRLTPCFAPATASIGSE